MNRMSRLRVAGDGIGRLFLFADEDFGGEPKVFTEGDANVAKTLKQAIDKVGSVVVQGNPWIVYPEIQFKGLPTFIEEGRYAKASMFPCLKSAASLRFLQDDLGSPEISLFSSSAFKGTSPWVQVSPDGSQTMRCVSVGAAGVWAARAKDDTVWVRMNEQNAKATSRLLPDTGMGDGWSRIQGGLRQLSVGLNSVWGVNADAQVNVRLGIADDTPLGKEWATVDGEPMKQVCVSGKGHVWAVDATEKIWYRKGASNACVLGTGWKMIPGNLKQISIGDCGVWGVSAEQHVWFRLNTVGDPDNEGTGWQRIEGRFQQIFSGPNCVLALAGNRDLYYRANVSEADTCSSSAKNRTVGANGEGTHWVRLEQGKDSKIVFKQMEIAGNSIWALDKDNSVFFKDKIYEDIGSHYSVTVYGDESEFRMYSFPDRATSTKVSSGGWAMYSEQNFQGKVLYQVGSESFSNDPPSKENPYKTWTVAVASARPIRGQNYRTPILRITMDWSKLSIKSSQNVLFSEELRNESEDYIDAPWVPTFDVETTATHKFKLSQAQNIAGCGLSVVRGCEFQLQRPEPISFETESGLSLNTGEEFNEQLTSLFTFKDELNSNRQSKKTAVVKLPPLVPPRCTFKVKICSYKAQVQVPFKADFKIGFAPTFELGSESWYESGVYEGTDDSNIKIELTSIKMPQQRKISRMINGLGEDM